jgi:uncharacterized protein YkwD
MPHVRRALCLSVSALALFLGGCGAGGFIEDLAQGARDEAPEPLPETGTEAAMSTEERAFAMDVLTLVNQVRTEHQLAPVTWHEATAAVAYGHSMDMDARNFFNHVNPSGQDPAARLAAGGVGPAWGVGENIAQGFRTPSEVMAGWMGSQGHRENILRPSWTHLGIGVHSAGTIWWTQLFVDLTR